MEEVSMRLIAIPAIPFAKVLLSSSASHADGTWCAQYGGFGGTNCGFYSFQQCQAALSGNGGFCQRNPWSSGSSNGYEVRRRQW